MSEMATLEIWRDTGFTEGSVEVPKVSSLSLSNPDFTFNDGLFPGKDRLFSVVKLEGEWLELYDCSYLRATYTLNNPRVIGEQQTSDTLTLYGWIDNVVLTSDNDERPITTITWHVDYWRTFASQAHYGYGLVTRRPRGIDDPIQNISYRYRSPGDYTSIPNASIDGIIWTYLAFNSKYTKDDKTYATVKICAIPVWSAPEKLYQHVYFKKTTGNPVQGICLGDVINNKFDEVLGLDPANISACYMSRVPPFDITSGSGTQASPIVLNYPESSESYPIQTQFQNTAKHLIEVKQIDSTHIRATWSDGSSPTTYHVSDYANFDIYGQFTSPGAYYTLNDDQTHRYGYYYVKKVDDFVRECIGDNFDTLANGTTFTMVDGLTTCDTFTHVTSTYPSLHVSMNVTGVQTNQTLTLNAGTFGNKYVIITDPAKNLILTSTGLRYANEIIIEKTSNADANYGNYITSASGNFVEHSRTLSAPLKTTDTVEWIFRGYDLSPIGSVPWGIEIKDFTVRPIVTSTGGYIEYRFGGEGAKLRGTCYIVPMPTVDVVSNATSSYLYSGQREYDIKQMEIARNKALVEGITGAISEGVGTGVMGSLKSPGEPDPDARYAEPVPNGVRQSRMFAETMATGKVPISKTKAEVRSELQRQAKLEALGYGIGQGIVGIAGSAINYMWDAYQSDLLIKATDQLKAKQAESITAFGNGWDWLWHGEDCQFVSLVADDYSLSRFDTDVSLNGIIVSEPMSDTDTMIRSAEGPLQVQGLIVTGSIPVQAKYALQNKLASGVRLI